MSPSISTGPQHYAAELGSIKATVLASSVSIFLVNLKITISSEKSIGMAPVELICACPGLSSQQTFSFELFHFLLISFDTSTTRERTAYPIKAARLVRRTSRDNRSASHPRCSTRTGRREAASVR